MKNWEIAQDRGWRAVSAQPQRTLTRYSQSFSSKFNDAITAESSNIRTCFFWGQIYKKDNFSAGEELGGSHRCWGRFFGRTSPLYNCRSSQCSAFCSPFGIEPMTSPLYKYRSFFRRCRLWLIVNHTKCRLWLFAKLNGTTSKQEKWYGSWLSPITKYNKSVIMTSTQWKKSFFIYAWSFLLHCSLDFVLKGPFETGMYSRKLLKVKWEQSIRLLCQ